MKMAEVMANMTRSADVVLHPVPPSPDNTSLPLPAAYREFLTLTDGAEGYGGYYRLFGVGAADRIGLDAWNDEKNWKFAWGERCDGFLFFGETAWGDQYAFRTTEIAADIEPAVYYVEGMTMMPTVIAPSFVAFLADEFLGAVAAPYDALTVQAREKRGEIPPDQNLVFVPSLLLGGTEELTNMTLMPAATAMRINGDIALQATVNVGRRVSAVREYQDEQGRARVTLIFE